MMFNLRGDYTLDELVNWLEQHIGYRTLENKSLVQGPGWSISPASLPMEGVAGGIRVQQEWVVRIDDEKYALLFRLRWA